MPQYTEYPTEKTTPSRKARKGSRTQTFMANKNAARKLKKARKEAREALLETQESVEE